MSPLIEGQAFGFQVEVTGELIDRFAAISGDDNPVHMNASHAWERGLPDRVAHGALLVALVSRLAGIHCPGEGGLLHSLSFQFKNPVHPGVVLSIEGIVDQVSESTGTVIVKVSMRNVETGTVHSVGKYQSGFRTS